MKIPEKMSSHKINKFDANWKFYNNFLKKQDALLADIFTSHQGEKPKYQYERILVGLLHRYAINFRTIYRCWPDFQNNSRFRFSIYTLLRPLIADALLMVYLLEEFKWIVPDNVLDNREEWAVNETRFLKRYEDISTAFFGRLDSYLKKKVKKTELSPEEMKDILSHQRNVFPEYFHDASEIRVRKHKVITPSQMHDAITYGKQFVKGLYDHYFWLSQFEHFTFITEQLMNDPNKEAELINVVEITDHLLDSLAVNISTIRINDKFRNKAIDLINGFRSTQWHQE